ncbi:MAG: helix-turn-helix domain-containing protein [Ktedonobacterales bacterium]
MPQTWEYADSFRPEFVGLVLQRLRNEWGWSQQEVAKRLGLLDSYVMLMEGTSPFFGKSFHRLYLYVTTILARSLYDVVREAGQWTNVIDEAQAVIQQLRHQGEPVTAWKVSTILGFTPQRLGRYPEVQAVIKEAVDYPNFEKDEHAIRRAFADITDHNWPATLEILHKVSSVPFSHLADYPRIAAERQEMAEQRATELLKEDEELLGRLRAAVAEWRSCGQPLSEQLLQQVCQMSWLGLLPFRQVRRQIAQWIPDPDVQTDWGRARHREAELVARIHEAMRDIEVDGTPLTPEAVRLRAQLPPAAEWRWPAVHDVFSDISSETGQPWTRQLAQQDEQLAAKVNLLIQGP